MPKTIFINGRFLTHRVTGVQRYAREVLRHMDLILGASPAFQDTKLICLAPPEEFEMPGWKNMEVHRVGANRGNLWEQIDLPFFARGHLLFSPANIGPWYYTNQVVTFHDAGVFAIPHAYSWAFRLKYAFVFRRLVRRARLILTVSKFSQEELAWFLHVPLERFTVIPSGSDHLDHVPADMSILTRHNLDRDSYLLTVADQGQHKNPYNVLEALKILGTDIKIVLVGARSGKVFRGNETLPSAGSALDLGYVTDGELKALYENALGFIFPSSYEGFGLPVLEAMRCGCPVVCSNAASLPEVAGEAALYFDPHQVKNIAAALNYFLSAPALQEQLRTKGHKRSAEFQWSRTAGQVLEYLTSVPETKIPHNAFSPAERVVKRLTDLVLILAVSPLILLLMVMITIAIKLDSPGGVFYSQKRIGRLGKVIHIWKFRSMAVDAEERLRLFLERSPSLKKEWEANHKLKNDPRITRFGRILRHTSLDELPQIWNVLRGEMSLIGPRPIVEEELELYGKDFEIYQQVLPGLTGLWQISGRNDLPYEQRVSLDVFYVQNWSIRLDMHILFQTILVTIQGRGAY